MTARAAPADPTWPRLELPVTPPYPPMEARLVEALPEGPGWLYEPKWDGFRCLAFRHRDAVALQSRAGQPLARYFPEVVGALAGLGAARFVLDGEIAVPVEGRLDFDQLLQRIHPSERRVRMLAARTPAVLIVFDLLVDDRARPLTGRPLAERRPALEAFGAGQFPPDGAVRLSPATTDLAVARDWLAGRSVQGLDGVVAKRLDAAYASGERTAVLKVKRRRTADCVVGGFRHAAGSRTLGSLLLGLYDEDGLLHHVGFTSSFTAEQRRQVLAVVEPRVEPPGFTGRAPGGPSRWSTERTGDWQPLRPELVCEVRYDHWSGDRFRHGTTFLRWRPDKAPDQCTFAQVRPAR